MTRRLKGQAGKIDEFLGKRLLRIRHMRGLSQETLANSMGVTFQQIQKYEKGTNRIAASRLYEFSKVLGVSVNDFFDGYETKPQGNMVQLLDRLPSDFPQVLALFNSLTDERERDTAIKSMILLLKILKEKQ